MSIPIIIDVGDPPRGGTRPALRIAAQSLNATFSWGLTPGTAAITYVSNATIASTPIQTGDGILITVGSHLFFGMCKLDTAKVGSDGNTRELQFADYREFLDWDIVYCAFNMPIVQLIAGQRIKRYWHILPDNYQSGTKTYTDEPYLAYEIADFMFNAATVNLAWVTRYNFVLNAPVYSLDYLGGRALGAALAEISERLGAVFTHSPTLALPFRLSWLRMGYGSLPDFPDNSDNRRIGSALSGYPSRLRLVGDRNLYQVLDVAMVKDWASAWEEFIDFAVFANDIYHRGGFDATEDDPEGFIGRQLAYARAKEITVREYADLRGSAFADTRKFNGHSRMDMPCALYIANLLFRAYRPPVETFANIYGHDVSLRNAEIAPRNLVQLGHDLTSGAITALNIPLTPGDGTGYAVAQGYMVGADLFATINPHQFDIGHWTTKQDLWQRVTFQVDDSGEGDQFIIFDQPIIYAPALVVEIDGHVVVRANPTIVVPSVKAALTFAAERYFYPNNDTGYLGVGSKDGVENVSGLNGEWLVNGSSLTEVLYPGGVGVDDKANDIAATLLARQPVFYEGGFQVRGIAGYLLSSIINRISVHVGPDGFWEQVDFTNERSRNYYEPERSLDRATIQNSQFPGQPELQKEARQARLIATGLKQSPQFRNHLQEVLDGRVGHTEPLRTVIVTSSLVSDVFPAGTPFFADPIDVTTSPNSSTQVHLGSGGGYFAGATVREGERGTMPLRVQASGDPLILVEGPVAVGDRLFGSNDTVTYLVKSGGDSFVGRALQEISSETVQLIKVRLSTAGSGGSGLYQLREVFPDYLRCRAVTINEDESLDVASADVFIAKPQSLRQTGWDGETIEDILYDNFNGDATQRRATKAATITEDEIIEQQYVTPDYVEASAEGGNRSIIRASEVEHTGVFVEDLELTLEEDSARAWALRDD